MKAEKVPSEIRTSAADLHDRHQFLGLAAQHYENFPVGSWLVPRPLRAHVQRLYAFARTADDIADELQDASALASFRSTLTAHLDGTDDSVPLFVDLTDSVRLLRLPTGLLYDLLDAFAEDLVVQRHSETSLFEYCHRSADPVGRLMLRIFGHEDAAKDRLSDSICTGLQLLNHLQDIRSDLLERNRIYFPLADLERFGVSESDLASEVANEAVRALVRHWTDRTATLLRDGFPLTGMVSGRLRLELRAIVSGAAGVIARIRTHDHDVLAHKIRLGRGRAVAWTLRALLFKSLPSPLARREERS